MLDIRYKYGITKDFDIQIFKDHVFKMCKDEANSRESKQVFALIQGQKDYYTDTSVSKLVWDQD